MIGRLLPPFSVRDVGEVRIGPLDAPVLAPIGIVISRCSLVTFADEAVVTPMALDLWRQRIQSYVGDSPMGMLTSSVCYCRVLRSCSEVLSIFLRPP